MPYLSSVFIELLIINLFLNVIMNSIFFSFSRSWSSLICQTWVIKNDTMSSLCSTQGTQMQHTLSCLGKSPCLSILIRIRSLLMRSSGTTNSSMVSLLLYALFLLYYNLLLLKILENVVLIAPFFFFHRLSAEWWKCSQDTQNCFLLFEETGCPKCTGTSSVIRKPR